MDVRLITKSGVEERGVEELPLLLQREDNLGWVDIPAWDDELKYRAGPEAAQT
jgi:hypothetical protein